MGENNRMDTDNTNNNSASKIDKGDIIKKYINAIGIFVISILIFNNIKKTMYDRQLFLGLQNRKILTVLKILQS